MTLTPQSAIGNRQSAIVYARVSTDEQDTQRQDRMLTEYCDRHELKIITRLEDPDTSGSIPFQQREGGGELLAILQEVHRARLEQGPIGEDEDALVHIITTEHDRIGRDVIDTVSTIRRLWDMGALPHFTAEGGPCPRTPINELIIGTRATTAQFERDLIRSRIRSKMKGKRQAGELCGTVPFGWDAIETGARSPKGVAIRKLVDNAVEQQWLHEMARLRTAGMSYHGIAKILNGAGIKPKRAGQLINGRMASDRWQNGNVAHVLGNRTAQAWLRQQSDLQ